ncbi:unnamed protein product [Eretmochelys imbricata]
MGNVLAASSPTPSPTMPSPGSGLVSVPPGFTMPPSVGWAPLRRSGWRRRGIGCPILAPLRNVTASAKNCSLSRLRCETDSK